MPTNIKTPIDFTGVDRVVRKLLADINTDMSEDNKVITLDAVWGKNGLEMMFLTKFSRCVYLSDLPSEKDRLHTKLSSVYDRLIALRLLLSSVVVINTDDYNLRRHFSITFTEDD